MTRGDKVLMACVLLAALACAVALYGRLLLSDRSQAARAVVTVGGRTARTFDLPATGIFLLEGRSGAATVEVDGMRIRMREAHCPGGICQRQGWIAHPGESIVCLPGEIVIRMEGAAALDAVTR